MNTNKVLVVTAVFACAAACICAAAPRAAELVESTHQLANHDGYSIARIDHCGINAGVDKNAHSVFVARKGKTHYPIPQGILSGWNHATNGSTSEWSGLNQPVNAYNFTSQPELNASCNNVGTLNMVLVKKIADWDHQHVNGIEYNLGSLKHVFGDMEALVLDIRIDSRNTHIPSPLQLKKTYANNAPLSAIDELDAGKVNLGITLNGEDNLLASAIVEVDQQTLSDQWLRITIPVKTMTFYQEVNYQRTHKEYVDLADHLITTLLIVSETHSGSVLRKRIEMWNSSIPESFKETGIAFRKIEFRLK